MTSIDYAASSTQYSTRSTPVNSVAAWLAGVLRALKNRREFYRLGQLSDVELHDIGLTRGDLAVPTDLPFTYDPTSNLGKSARQRINRMETYARYVA